MITPDRFLVDKGRHPQEWVDNHARSVSATTVAKAATPAGFRDVVASWGEPVEPNVFMEFGTRWEPFIADFVKDRFGVMPCDWTIRAEQNPLHVASPDGLSLDHTRLGEFKTTGKDWDVAGKGVKGIPIGYRRQVQWQLYVTGATECVFAWLLRDDSGESPQPAWWEPRTLIIGRDEEMITDLRAVADRLIKELEL